MQNDNKDFELNNFNHLVKMAINGDFGINAQDTFITGAFWVNQTTRFPNSDHRYYNRYLLLRVEDAFGACSLEQDQLPHTIAETLSGCSVASLLEDDRNAIKTAGLDAFLGMINPLSKAPNAKRLTLPAGTPLQRAKVRDAAIASTLPKVNNKKVCLIGVVNPLVEAIEKVGGTCLPCDFNMEQTSSGIPVSRDMSHALQIADIVVATGMTLSNGSFEVLLETCKKREIPLIMYAQTGANILCRFIGHGVTAVIAETFPFSQFSAEETPFYVVT